MRFSVNRASNRASMISLAKKVAKKLPNVLIRAM